MNTTSFSFNCISFIPGFLDRFKNDIFSDHKLSTSDRRDYIDWDSNLHNVLTCSKDPVNVTPRLSSLCKLYDATGEFVFNEDNIYLNDKPLFDIKTWLTDDGYILNIYCYDGVGSIISKRNTVLSFKITTWLVDYMVRRLGEEATLRSYFFHEYWLNKS